MQDIFAIVTGTPLWVYPIFCYLIFVGVKATKTTFISIKKLFIIPIVFLGINFHMFLSNNFIQLIVVLILSTAVSSYLHYRVKIEVLQDLQSVAIPGSYSNLIIFMLFFTVKYYFGYLNSTAPDLSLKYRIFEEIIRCIFSGYFLGRAGCFAYKYNLAAYKA